MNTAKVIKHLRAVQEQSSDPELTAIIERAVDACCARLAYLDLDTEPCCAKAECGHADRKGVSNGAV